MRVNLICGCIGPISAKLYIKCLNKLTTKQTKYEIKP